MKLDLATARQLVTLAIGAAKMAGADSPAFTKVTGGISTLLGQIPDASVKAERTRLDAGLADAVKARRAAFDRSRDAGAARPE